MSEQIDRREFVKATALGVVGATAGQALAAAPVTAERAKPAGIRKGVVQSMLPSRMPWPDRLAMLRDAGFDGFEAYTTSDPKEVETIRAAAERAKLTIHSVMNQAHWQYPLSSADPKVVATSMEGMRTSLHNAKAFGAETVLLVPAVVNPETRYADAYTRSQRQIRELLPLAQELDIIIAVEEVWNKFLLSPIEFVHYIDEFQSPFVGAYFDVGNIVAYGYPQDWIRTLGKRIKKVHIKDFDVKAHKFVPLYEGSINWPEVRAAFAEIGYSGWFTAELPGGDAKYLGEVARRMDRIIAGR